MKLHHGGKNVKVAFLQYNSSKYELEKARTIRHNICDKLEMKISLLSKETFSALNLPRLENNFREGLESSTGSSNSNCKYL